MNSKIQLTNEKQRGKSNNTNTLDASERTNNEWQGEKNKHCTWKSIHVVDGSNDPNTFALAETSKNAGWIWIVEWRWIEAMNDKKKGRPLRCWSLALSFFFSSTYWRSFRAHGIYIKTNNTQKKGIKRRNEIEKSTRTHNEEQKYLRLLELPMRLDSCYVGKKKKKERNNIK